MYFKIFVAAIFFQSNILMAQTSSSVNLNTSNSAVQANLQPDEPLKTCVQTNQVDAQGNPIYDYAYQQCQQYNAGVNARNAQRAQTRAYTNRGAADAQQVLNGTLVAPVNNCVATPSANGGYDYAYQQCMQQYNAQMVEYSRKKQAADLAAQAQADAAAGGQTAEQKRLATLNDKTATGSLAEVQQKNQEGQSIYQTAASLLAAYAAYKFVVGGVCAATCAAAGTGCCGAAPGLFAAGAAFMLLNGMANNQASQHAQSAGQACQAFNQLSSAQKDCSAAAPTNLPVTTVLDNNGKCLPTAPPGCVDVVGAGSGPGVGKIPTNCKDSSGHAVSCLASAASIYKQNSNGTVTVKTPSGDKNYSMADFADKKSMMAAGLSAAAADSLMTDLYGKNSALNKAGLDAKDMSKNTSHDANKKFGDFSSSGGMSPNLGAVDLPKGVDKKFGEKLNEKLGDAVADRRPSSEGLSRDYNGDLIGSAGDDIFLMLKRRYNLKNQQDSFIAP